MRSLSQVGGKNASLGEMTTNLSFLGIEVPDGYAITVETYNEFLFFNNISSRLTSALNNLNHKTLSNLSEVGASKNNHLGHLLLLLRMKKKATNY